MAIVFLISTISLFIFTILFSIGLMKASSSKQNNNTKNDNDGGLSIDNLPIIDIPPGFELEDILVDRWHDDVPTSRKSK